MSAAFCASGLSEARRTVSRRDSRGCLLATVATETSSNQWPTPSPTLVTAPPLGNGRPAGCAR